MLEKVKLALRISTNAFDGELQDLIDAGCDDLRLAGVIVPDDIEGTPLVCRAVVTYCRMMFGEPNDYDRIKESYESQKGQLTTATGYTDWGE